MDNIVTIGIVGYGTIGQELAHDLSDKGKQIYVVDSNSAALDRAVTAGKFSGVYESIGQLPDGLHAIVEGVPEVPDLKAGVMQQIDAAADPETYILTVSSTMPSSSFAGLVSNPARLMNAHVLPDLHYRRFVELQGPGDHTDRDAMDYLKQQFEGLDFHVCMVNGESPGFLVNRMWHSLMFATFELLKTYTPIEVDFAVHKYLGVPYGPCMSMDMIGYDTLFNVFSRVQESMGIPIPDHVRQMHDSGSLGLKTGSGFFVYESCDYSGLHAAAKSSLSEHKDEPIEQIASAVWANITQSAAQLVGDPNNPQDAQEVRKAVKFGFPIHLDPFNDLQPEWKVLDE